jgi:hypothetical protein
MQARKPELCARTTGDLMINVRPQDHQVAFADRKAAFLDLNDPLTLIDVDHLKGVMVVHADVMMAVVYVEAHLNRKCWIEVTKINSFGIDNGAAPSVGVRPKRAA